MKQRRETVKYAGQLREILRFRRSMPPASPTEQKAAALTPESVEPPKDVANDAARAEETSGFVIGQTIEKPLKVAVIGESGSGKSEFLKACIGTRGARNFPYSAASQTTTAMCRITTGVRSDDGGETYYGYFKFMDADTVRGKVSDCITDAIGVYADYRNTANRVHGYYSPKRHYLEMFNKVSESVFAASWLKLFPLYGIARKSLTYRGIEAKDGSAPHEAIVEWVDGFLDDINAAANECEQAGKPLEDALIRTLNMAPHVEDLVRKAATVFRTKGWSFGDTVYLESNDMKEFIAGIEPLVRYNGGRHKMGVAAFVEKVDVFGTFPEAMVSANHVQFIDTVGFGHALKGDHVAAMSGEMLSVILEADAVIILNSGDLIIREGTKRIIRRVVSARGHANGVWLFATQMDKKENDIRSGMIEDEDGDEDMDDEDVPDVPQEAIYAEMSQRLTSHLRAVVNDIQAEGQWEDGAAVMFNELKRPDLILCTGYLHPRESYINEEGKRVTRKVVTPDWVLESLRKRMREITAPVEVGAIEKAISPVYRIADFATLVEKAIALFVGKWVGSEGNWLSNRHHWGSKRALILKSVNNVFFHSGATRLAPVEELNELISEQVGHFVANPVRWMGEEADLRSSGRKDVVLKQVGKDLADEMEDTCAKILYGKAMMPKWAKAVATDSESFGKGCSAERHRQMNEAFGVALSKCRNSLLRGVHTGLEVRSEVLDDTDKVLSMKQD